MTKGLMDLPRVAAYDHDLAAEIAGVLGHGDDHTEWPMLSWCGPAEAMARIAGAEAAAAGEPRSACPFPPAHPAAKWWYVEWLIVVDDQREAAGTANLTEHELTMTVEERAAYRRAVGYVGDPLIDPAAEVLDGWEPTPKPDPPVALDPQVYFAGYDPATWAGGGGGWLTAVFDAVADFGVSMQESMAQFGAAFERSMEQLAEAFSALAAPPDLDVLDYPRDPVQWLVDRNPLDPLAPPYPVEPIDVSGSFQAALPPRPDFAGWFDRDRPWVATS